MKLYKYRSLENIEFVFDILLSQRLHCAPFETLNDPLEGIFMWVKRSALMPFGNTTPKSIKDMPVFGSTRICSLAATMGDVRLWSYYAQGHTGVAIEVDLDDSDSQLHEVEYVRELKAFKLAAFGGPSAEEILRLKTHHWQHEIEYRIICDDEYVSITDRITGVYFGLRTADVMRKAIINNVPNTIPVFSTKLDERNIKVIVDSQLN